MDTYVRTAAAIAEKTGEVLLRAFMKNGNSKRGTSKEVHSRYDLVADRLIVRALCKAYPDHHILTEESGHNAKRSRYCWIVDPLDGTGNFENGNPFFAVSIALWIDGRPHCGVVDAPALGERYIATRGEGSIGDDRWAKNRRKPAPSTISRLRDAYIVFCEGGLTARRPMVSLYETLYPRVKDMRKLGSAALETVWVATGRADAYLTKRARPWDVAAGLIIAAESGATVTAWGAPFPWDVLPSGKAVDVAVTNGRLVLPHSVY